MELGHDSVEPSPRESPGRFVQGQLLDRPATSLVHPPLLGLHDIRLLRLLPGSFDQDIQCDISVHDLSLALDYEAVSYTWADETGNDDLCKTLSVSGHPLSISRNCENALRRVRELHDARVIWIDAVCINQGDIHEKGHQVRLMSLIYSRARCVLVYIGEAANDSTFCLNMVVSPHELAGTGWQRRSFLAPLKGLFYRPYWFRTWVIQECLFAQAAIVICGETQAPLIELTNCWLRIQSRRSPAEGVDFSFMKVRIVNNVRPAMHPKVQGLLNLLDVSRKCKAKDPHDKVYAILELITDDSNRGLTADYNLSVKDLYIKVALDLALHYGLADDLVRAGVKRRRIRKLPSWVPDWSFPAIPYGTMGAAPDHRPEMYYDGSDSTLIPLIPSWGVGAASGHHSVIQYDETDRTLNFKACCINYMRFEQVVYLFYYDTDRSNCPQDDSRMHIPRGLYLFCSIFAPFYDGSYVGHTTLFLVDLLDGEYKGTQLEMTISDACLDHRKLLLAPVRNVEAVAVLTTADEIFLLLDSIFFCTFVRPRMGEPWLKLFWKLGECEQDRSLYLVPKDIILDAVRHEMRPPNKIDSLWRDTMALDPSTQAKLRAAEEYRDSNGILVRPNDYELLLELNDAIWKMLVRLFLVVELDVKIT